MADQQAAKTRCPSSAWGDQAHKKSAGGRTTLRVATVHRCHAGRITMSARKALAWNAPPKLPPTHFVSGEVYGEALFAEERSRIFERTWHLACHESEVPEPFDFRTLDYVGKPLLVVRGEDGRVRAFLNACPHRGAKIIHEPSGNARRFTCFYHLWTFDPEGACIDIPRPEGYAGVGLRKEDVGLREIRTEVQLGLVFINLDDTAAPLAGYLGDALKIFEGPMGTVPLEVFHYSRAVLDANWKGWQETNLDVYHEFMHVLLRRTQMTAGSLDDRRVVGFPNGHAHAGGLKAKYENYKGMQQRASTLVLPTIQPDDFVFGTIWPHVALLARGTTIRIDVVTPIDAHRTLIEWRGLGIKGDSPEDRQVRVRHHNQYWGPFGRNVPEDAFAAEAIALGFGPGASRYQVIAREEGGSGQDDGMLRTWYAEWSRRMGRPASDPRLP
ncbi:MAG: aromatic ring-hydroxylating dioxygenase subunit alpha [Alphaproteobacteria bacterium]|nr:aromatic ring-hydroxylating dioxygenase subunit alpha [Alphaproteobacteria bacterium]